MNKSGNSPTIEDEGLEITRRKIKEEDEEVAVVLALINIRRRRRFMMPFIVHRTQHKSGQIHNLLFFQTHRDHPHPPQLSLNHRRRTKRRKGYKEKEEEELSTDLSMVHPLSRKIAQSNRMNFVSRKWEINLPFDHPPQRQAMHLFCSGCRTPINFLGRPIFTISFRNIDGSGIYSPVNPSLVDSHRHDTN